MAFFLIIHSMLFKINYKLLRGSVANANDAKVSMIKLTQSI